VADNKRMLLNDFGTFSVRGGGGRLRDYQYYIGRTDAATAAAVIAPPPLISGDK